MLLVVPLYNSMYLLLEEPSTYSDIIKSVAHVFVLAALTI